MAKPTQKADAAAKVKPEPVETETVADLVLRKKDFIERVVVQSGAKRSEVKKVSEAVLKVLGEALSAGEGLHLPPLGRAKIARSIDKTGGDMLVIKLKRMSETDEKTSDLGLAPAEE